MSTTSLARPRLGRLAAPIVAILCCLGCSYSLPTFDNPRDPLGACYAGDQASSSSSQAASSAKYYVYGGNDLIFGTAGGTDAYHPEDHGYTLLGTAAASASFEGAYQYYVIVVRQGSFAIDAVLDQSGLPLKPHWTGNASSNDLSKAQDGIATTLSGDGTNASGLGFDRSGAEETAIRVVLAGS